MSIFSSRQYRDFVARLGVSTAVLGSTFALGFVSVTSVRSMLLRQELERADQPVTAVLGRPDMLTPVEKQIEDNEAILTKLQDPVTIDITKKKLAALYSQLGKKSSSMRDFTRTEVAYQQAIKLDPSNPAYMADLAALYNERASGHRDASMRVALYRSSRLYYQQASRRARQPAIAQAYTSNAGVTTLSLARDLVATGRRGEATEMLQDAATWATPDLIKKLTAIVND